MAEEQLKKHGGAWVVRLAFLKMWARRVGNNLLYGAKHKAMLKSNIYWESSLKSLQVRSAVKQLATSTALCEMSTQHLFSSPAHFAGEWRGWF